MSQELSELRNQLERWRSYNEVHARPADKELYEFLSGLLKRINEYEVPEVVSSVPETTQVASTDDEGGPGGNHPSDPTGNP
jgi:hypothetical protein